MIRAENAEKTHASAAGELARWRGKNVGFVFHSFHLIPTLTALSMAIGLCGWAIAAAGVAPLGEMIGTAMVRALLHIERGLEIGIDPRGMIVWLAVSLGGGALAALVPALQASRAPVRDALAHE